MEFTKEISFDEKLTADKVAKINYHGKLLNTNSDNISIIYGFGQNWECTEERKMKKVDDGYEVEVPIKAYDTFNFCFRDGNNNWDNNSQFNYISPINKEGGNNSSGSGSGGEKKYEQDEDVLGVDSIIDADAEDDEIKVELAQIEAELTRVFDELFGYNDEPKEPDIEEAFNQLFAEAGYNETYDSYREGVECEQEVASAFNQLFDEAGYDETYDSYRESVECEQEVASAFNQLFDEAGYDETYDSYRESVECEQEVLTVFNQLFEEAGYDKTYEAKQDSSVEESTYQVIEPKPEEREENDEDKSDIETIFDLLFKEAGYTETYKSYRESVNIEQAVANTFNQLFAEAGYDMTYDDYRQSIEDEVEVNSITVENISLASAQPEPSQEPVDEEQDSDVYDIGKVFDELFKEAGYTDTYESYRESVNIEQAVADTFNQLFAEAGYTENYDSYRESVSTEQEIASAFNQLFDEAGYAENYDSYCESVSTEQEIASTFNQLFAEAGYDIDYDSYRAELAQTQENLVPKAEQVSQEDSLDDLVDEILKPLSDEYAVPEEVADVNQVSTADDFDGIDIKSIDLEDMDDIEIDDSTRDELQKLIEEIDSQIALFEENEEEEDNSDFSVEDEIANIEETIQIPEIKNLEFDSEDDSEEEYDSVAKATTNENNSDVTIDELFDYLKKYDDEDEEITVQEDDEEDVEEKLAMFDELDDNQTQDIKEENTETEVKNVQLAEETSDDQSIFDKVKEQKQDDAEEVTDIAVSSRKLRNFYRITKKIKLAFIKVFYGIPKILGKTNSTDNNE